jgi:uncharacterized YigZ family protein
LRGEGSAEIIIEKSRFIGLARAVSVRGEAEDFFARARSEYKGATHYVPAFALGAGRELLWASDDGEPQGTAGAPILALLEGLDLTNAAIMAVRYFGGVKLGTGGLARAYTETAKQAVLSAGIAGVHEAATLRYETEYAFFDKLKRALENAGGELSELSYEEKIRFSVSLPIEDEEDARALVAAVTAGGAILLEEKKLDIKRPID